MSKSSDIISRYERSPQKVTMKVTKRRLTPIVTNGSRKSSMLQGSFISTGNKSIVSSQIKTSYEIHTYGLHHQKRLTSHMEGVVNLSSTLLTLFTDWSFNLSLLGTVNSNVSKYNTMTFDTMNIMNNLNNSYIENDEQPPDRKKASLSVIQKIASRLNNNNQSTLNNSAISASQVRRISCQINLSGFSEEEIEDETPKAQVNDTSRNNKHSGVQNLNYTFDLGNSIHKSKTPKFKNGKNINLNAPKLSRLQQEKLKMQKLKLTPKKKVITESDYYYSRYSPNNCRCLSPSKTPDKKKKTKKTTVNNSQYSQYSQRTQYNMMRSRHKDKEIEYNDYLKNSAIQLNNSSNKKNINPHKTKDKYKKLQKLKEFKERLELLNTRQSFLNE